MSTKVRSVNCATCLKYREVWTAISLVGERMTARAPTTLECYLSLSTIGMTNAPVLPLPVLAIAITLKPSMMTGIAFL